MTNIKYLIPLLCVLFVGCTNTSNKEDSAYQFVKPLPADKSPFKGSPMLSTSEYVSETGGPGGPIPAVFSISDFNFHRPLRLHGDCEATNWRHHTLQKRHHHRLKDRERQIPHHQRRHRKWWCGTRRIRGRDIPRSTHGRPSAVLRAWQGTATSQRYLHHYRLRRQSR